MCPQSQTWVSGPRKGGGKDEPGVRWQDLAPLVTSNHKHTGDAVKGVFRNDDGDVGSE